MSVLSFPTVTDDSGLGQDGTVFNNAFFDSIKTAVEAVTHSVTNPGVDPNDVVDEVVTARGNLSTLNGRLNGVIDADGALITPASIVSSSQLQSQAGASINLAKNSTFFLWSGGLTSAPDYYTLANGTITIAGTGESDTERYVGRHCAKITWSSGTTTLTQKIIDSGDFSDLDHLKVETKKLGFGAWVKTSIASHARIQLDDGVNTTETSFHTGGGGWEFLSAVHTMSSAATKLDLVHRVASSGSAYFSGVVCAFGDFAPTLWYPEPIVRGSAMIEFAGDLSTGDGKKYLHFNRPIRIDNLQAFIVTAPVGAGINIDVERNESSWQSMVTAGEIIADGDQFGDMQPSGDYDHRCLGGIFQPSGSNPTASAVRTKMMRINIDQVGSSTAGANMFLRVDGVQCLHPFEDQMAYDSLGV